MYNRLVGCEDVEGSDDCSWGSGVDGSAVALAVAVTLALAPADVDSRAEVEDCAGAWGGWAMWMVVGTLDDGRTDGRIVVVGDNGTGLKPSTRVVDAAGTIFGFKSIEGGVGEGEGSG